MPKDISKVFKAYDIRGLSPGELTADFTERLGRALVRRFRCKHVMVGRDMRQSSPELEDALVRGITSQGADVTRIGLCSTPMFNVSMGRAAGRYDFGVMVTASHNPPKYNGFKMVDGNVYPVGEGSGMEELRDAYISGELYEDAATPGDVHDDTEALRAYLDSIFDLVDTSEFPAMTIAADAGNGMNGLVLPEFAKRLPSMHILPLFWELDGRFPNHEANPLKIETLTTLSETVVKNHCRFGVAFDGDGDRVGFVDENGEPIPGDLMTAILAGGLLKDHPDALILRDLRCSWSTEEAILAAGGRTDMTRVGHAFIKRQLRERGGLFGGELSMHYYFRDLWGVESGDLCLLLLMKILSETEQPLSSLWKPLKRYANSGEVNSEVRNKDAVLDRIRKQYQSEATDIREIDGIRMEFYVREDGSKDDLSWWFSVRASNTEQLIRLIVEAVRPDVMEAKREELLDIIRS